MRNFIAFDTTKAYNAGFQYDVTFYTLHN